MITLTLGKQESFNEETNEFEYSEGFQARFEYSLKIIYDWEVLWRKPFLKGDYTHEELLDFYMRMAIDPVEEKYLTTEVQQALANYIQDSNTATTFTTPKGTGGFKNKAKIYTSEELYALMFSAGVPLDFETRNLNRLLVILRIIGSYNSPPKKMSKQDVLRENASLNAQRKAQLNTRG